MILNTDFTAGGLAWKLEAAEAHAHRLTAPRGRWLVPLLQLLIGSAVWLANQVDIANE